MLKTCWKEEHGYTFQKGETMCLSYYVWEENNNLCIYQRKTCDSSPCIHV